MFASKQPETTQQLVRMSNCFLFISSKFNPNTYISSKDVRFANARLGIDEIAL